MMDKSDDSVNKKLPTNNNQLGVSSVKNPGNLHKELFFNMPLKGKLITSLLGGMYLCKFPGGNYLPQKNNFNGNLFLCFSYGPQ